MTNYLFNVPDMEEKITYLKIILPTNLEELFDEIYKEELNRLSIRLNKKFTKEEERSIIQKSRDLLDHTVHLTTSNNTSIFDTDSLIITNFTNLGNKTIKLNSSILKDEVIEVSKIEELYLNMIYTTYRTSVVYSILGHK